DIMKKIEKGSNKHLIIQCVTIIVVELILFPLFDLVYAKLFTHSKFVYSVTNHIVEPLILGIVISICLFVIYRKSNKK
ncbi:MAG: hypothetical protein IJI43_01175, partial [Bacilli bacterium]|nr:hypothetical protein [Bacilli bacterium]